MVEAACGAIQFDREGNSRCCARSKAEKQSQAETISNPEYDRVGDHPGDYPQRTMLAAKQVVGQIKTAKNVEACSNNADRREGMVIHYSGTLPLCSPARDSSRTGDCSIFPFDFAARTR